MRRWMGMTQTAVAYYRTSSATNVGQVSIRQKSGGSPPLSAGGSLEAGYQCTESAYSDSGALHSDKDSLIRQQEAVRGYAANRGLHIVREFYDAAVSGADPIDTRPEFPELITSDSPDSFISDTPTATFIRQVLGAVSQLEKTMLVQKLRGARDRKSRLLGERVEGGKAWKALRNPAAIIMAREVRQTEPELSLRGISERLALAGIVSASGKQYGPQSIKRMLRMS